MCIRDRAKIVALFKPIRAFPLLNVGRNYKVETEEKKGGQVMLSNFSLLGEEAGVEYVELTPAYLDNLCRLGLVDFLGSGTHYTSPGLYEPLENHPDVLAVKSGIEANPEMKCELQRTGFKITELGKQFAKVCVFRK